MSLDTGCRWAGVAKRRHAGPAAHIFSVIPTSSKALALLLSADVRLIDHIVSELRPAIVHLGASTDLLTPSTVQQLKQRFAAVTLVRSIPVVGDESIATAQCCDGIADMLLVDSHRPGDVQIGALGVTHSWPIDRKIVESVRIPVHHRGRTGPDNALDAIRAGVDSKAMTDKNDGSHTKDLQKVKQFVARAQSLNE